MNDSQRVSILSEALPYIQKFFRKKNCYKIWRFYHGKRKIKKAFFRDIALLSSVGVCPVVIHGGGPEINSWLSKLEISPKFENGLRVTDQKTMDIVEMVLMGQGK